MSLLLKHVPLCSNILQLIRERLHAVLQHLVLHPNKIQDVEQFYLAIQVSSCQIYIIFSLKVELTNARTSLKLQILLLFPEIIPLLRDLTYSKNKLNFEQPAELLKVDDSFALAMHKRFTSTPFLHFCVLFSPFTVVH